MSVVKATVDNKQDNFTPNSDQVSNLSHCENKILATETTPSSSPKPSKSPRKKIDMAKPKDEEDSETNVTVPLFDKGRAVEILEGLTLAAVGAQVDTHIPAGIALYAEVFKCPKRNTN